MIKDEVIRVFCNHVPYIVANQQTECGLNCVCMLLHYYGKKVSMIKLRKELEVGRDGSSLEEIKNLLNKKNFDTHAYKATIDTIPNLPMPAIIFWENSHFVVLEKIKKGIYVIVDPQVGRRNIEYDEMEKGYSGVVLTAVPNENFEKEKSDNSFYKIICSILFEKKSLYLKIIVTSLITYAFTIIMPIFLQNIIDNLSSGNVNLEYISIFSLLILVSTLYLFFNILNQKCIMSLKIYADQQLNIKSFSHILCLPLKYFELRNKGDIIYNLNTINSIREIFTSQLIQGVIDCGATIFILIYMFSQSPMLAIIALGLFLVNILILFISYPFLIENSQEVIAEQGKLQGIQIETIFSILGIKMMGIEKSIFSKWFLKFEYYIKKTITKEKFNIYINCILSFLTYISPIVILCAGIILAQNKTISLGVLVAFYTLSGNFYSLARSVFTTWTGFVNSRVLFERLADILLTEHEDTHEIGINKEIEGNIELNSVFYKYTENSNYVLKNINIRIKKGSKIAIVGKSGEGKSTLAKLIVGLYKPSNGKIFFDGFELTEWNLKALRRQIGIVPQEILLFNKSIFQNIVGNDEEASLEDVKRVCKITQIADEIESMPMGYETIISEMGSNLSGGQRQRIMLARAILNNPKILILDEATSAIDNINEEKISEVFREIECTQIIIAHRMSTIEDADVIYVLENGTIVEQGKHQELLEKKGKYFALYSQNGGEGICPNMQ